jgi:FtsZ-binding cell division protein ZapB
MTIAASNRQVGGDHYRAMGTQPWDVVEDWSLEQQIGAFRKDALKYIMRAGDKGDILEDFEKAYHVLEKLIEVITLARTEEEILQERKGSERYVMDAQHAMEILEREREERVDRVRETWAERTQPEDLIPSMPGKVLVDPAPKDGPQPACFSTYEAARVAERGCFGCQWEQQCFRRTIDPPTYPWPAGANQD